jgi:hypothetical protein
MSSKFSQFKNRENDKRNGFKQPPLAVLLSKQSNSSDSSTLGQFRIGYTILGSGD